MRKLSLCGLFLLFSALATVAQTPPVPDPSDPLGINEFLEPPRVIALWGSETPGCDRFAIDGTYYYTIRLSGVTTAMTFKDTGEYLFARIIVLNNSDKSILVEPSAVKIFYEDKKGKEILLSALDPQKIVNRYAKRVMWASVFGSLAAGMAQRTSTVETTSRGSINTASGTVTYRANGTAVVTEPDYAAQRRVAAQNAANARNARSESEAFLSNALRANTVLPGQSVGGDLYFKREKFKEGALIVTVDDVDYMLVIKRNYSQ